MVQLIKEAMVTLQDKKILIQMYSLDAIFSYLNKSYNDDGNLSNTTFSYLCKLVIPKNSKESHSDLTEIFHNLKIFDKSQFTW